MSTNVTEQRRRTEEQESVFSLSVDLMCVAGFDGYFKRLNHAFKTTLGYDNELLERPFPKFVHPDEVQATQAIVGHLVVGDLVEDSSNRYRAKSGEYQFLSRRGGAAQKQQVLYAVARDITDTRALDEQLQQSKRLEAIGQLAGGIAHNFNNLLLAVDGNIEFALEEPELTASSLGDALEASKRVASLTVQEGSPRPASVAPGQYVSLTVSDTGSGMTPEVKTRIFEPFFQPKRWDEEQVWA